MAEDRIIEGRILKGVGGFYYVADQNRTIHECKARGRFRNENIKPLPGDKVIFVQQNDNSYGFIEDILPRENELIRPQVANVDQVVITMTIKNPKPDLMLVDKLLIIAQSQKIVPVLCINKADIVLDDEIKDIKVQYEKCYPVIVTSCKTGKGIKELKRIFKDKITCFAGQSAVGKSSLINKISENLNLEVGGLSKKIDRGKHTTRHTELLMIDDVEGIVVDTPGFSVLENTKIEKYDLDRYYPEMAEYLDACRFSSCIHGVEPNCAVKQAVEQKLIDQRRYQRYLKIIEEFDKMEERKKW